MSSAGKNISFSISVTRESSAFILQYIVVLISTSEPENMSPQLHLGVKLSPMLVFGLQNGSVVGIPIGNYYRNLTKIHHRSQNFRDKISTTKKEFFSKHIFQGHVFGETSSKIKFHCNPSTELAARLSYTVTGNSPKIKQTLTCSNGCYHIPLVIFQ